MYILNLDSSQIYCFICLCHYVVAKLLSAGCFCQSEKIAQDCIFPVEVTRNKRNQRSRYSNKTSQVSMNKFTKSENWDSK